MDGFYRKFPLITYQIKDESSPFPTSATLIGTKTKHDKVHDTGIKLFFFSVAPFNVPMASIANGTGLMLVNIVSRTDTHVNAILYGTIDFASHDMMHYTTKPAVLRIASPKTLSCATDEFRLISNGDGCVAVSEPMHVPVHLSFSVKCRNRTLPPTVSKEVIKAKSSANDDRIKNIKNVIDMQRDNTLFLNVIETAILDEGFESLMLIIRRNRHNKQFYSGLLSYVHAHVAPAEAKDIGIKSIVERNPESSIQTAPAQTTNISVLSNQQPAFVDPLLPSILDFTSLFNNHNCLDTFLLNNE